MKTFSEFVNGLDPEFFEGFEKEEDKEEKDAPKGKKMPPWLAKKGKDKDEDCDDEKEEKGEKKENPFLKNKKCKS